LEKDGRDLFQDSIAAFDWMDSEISSKSPRIAMNLIEIRNWYRYTNPLGQNQRISGSVLKEENIYMEQSP
jgi:hypothetical protein